MSTSGDRRKWSVFSGWRVLLFGNSHFPFSALFLTYGLLDGLASWALRWASHKSASPYWNTTTFEDSLGGDFCLTEPDSAPAWMVGLFMALFVSSAAQRGVFAAWIAFGPGKWHIRLMVSIIACACLYAIMQVPLSVPVELWRDALIPYAAMPLELLSFAAPLALAAIWSGRRLQHLTMHSNNESNSRHFAISDILWITAVIAVTIALARWKDIARGPVASAVPNSVVAAGVVATFSTIYILPVLWATLAVRRWQLALLLVGFLTALFAVPVLLAGDADSDSWSLEIGAACGFLMTIPCSLLLWRFCGYRLVWTGPNDREAGRSAKQSANGPGNSAAAPS